MEERYIEWIVGLEKLTSIFRIVQTMLVLMEWLLPLLEDVRLNANQRDIMTMFRDHLSELEIEMQRQIFEMRERILGRYLVTCITPYIVNQIQRQEAKKPKVPGAGFLFA